MERPPLELRRAFAILAPSLFSMRRAFAILTAETVALTEDVDVVVQTPMSETPSLAEALDSVLNP